MGDINPYLQAHRIENRNSRVRGMGMHEWNGTI